MCRLSSFRLAVKQRLRPFLQTNHRSLWQILSGSACNISPARTSHAGLASCQNELVSKFNDLTCVFVPLVAVWNPEDPTRTEN